MDEKPNWRRGMSEISSAPNAAMLCKEEDVERVDGRREVRKAKLDKRHAEH